MKFGGLIIGDCALARLHDGIERPEPGTGYVLSKSPLASHLTSVLLFPPNPSNRIKVTFKDSKGTILKTVEASEGDDILSIAHEYDIDLEGACEGSIACSTCHVILDPEFYDLLPEPSDDENDMLDMAFGLTDTSRLGCQVSFGSFDLFLRGKEGKRSCSGLGSLACMDY